MGNTNLRKLFRIMDDNDSGEISLKELDPDAANHELWITWREQLWDDATCARTPGEIGSGRGEVP